MALFYFHFRNGDYVERDTTGIDLPDLATARQQGELAIHDLMQEQIAAGSILSGDQSFEVCDKDGTIVFTLEFKDILRG